MDNLFLNLPGESQAALINAAEDQLGLVGHVIEKDIWVCWFLEKLFELPIAMVFKGGTSLSKGYGLLKRFSEDVDVTIDYRNFRDHLDLKNISRSQLKKLVRS